MTMSRAFMLMAGMILFLNMTLIAFDSWAPSPEFSLFGEQGLGGEGLTTTFLKNAFLTDVEEVDPQTTAEAEAGTSPKLSKCDSGNFYMDLSCTIGNLFFGAIQAGTEVLDVITAGLKLLAGVAIFVLSQFPNLIGGYATVLTNLANKVEPDGTAIHMFVLGIEGIVTIIYVFGAFFFIKEFVTAGRRG